MIFNDIKVTIDKEYKFPTIAQLTTKQFIKLSEALKKPDVRDDEIIAELLQAPIQIIESLDLVEFRKLQILAENLLLSPASPLDYNINFLPLASYPFGQFADWIQVCKQFNFDERSIAYSVAYLRPNTSFKQRNEIYLPWAEQLPACVCIYYHSQIMQEYEHLQKTFALNTTEASELEIKAGIQHLAKYGEYLTIFELTNGDIAKVEKIAKMSVAEVLTYLRTSKDVATYKREINVLRNGI